MENKKNPEFDLERNRLFYFLLGLLCSVFVVFTAFEWKGQQPSHVIDLKKEKVKIQAAEILERYKKDSIQLASQKNREIQLVIE